MGRGWTDYTGHTNEKRGVTGPEDTAAGAIGDCVHAGPVRPGPLGTAIPGLDRGGLGGQCRVTAAGLQSGRRGNEVPIGGGNIIDAMLPLAGGASIPSPNALCGQCAVLRDVAGLEGCTVNPRKDLVGHTECNVCQC